MPLGAMVSLRPFSALNRSTKERASRPMSPGRSRKGRQEHRNHVDAIVEVGAELALGHRMLEILVGGADQPHVHLERALAADAFEFALLQHAQQLGLERRRYLADLVEQQRAAVGELEASGPLADGAGEGALLVAEQLRFEHALGQRGAIELDEGLRSCAATDHEWRGRTAPCRCRFRRAGAPSCWSWRRPRSSPSPCGSAALADDAADLRPRRAAFPRAAGRAPSPASARSSRKRLRSAASMRWRRTVWPTRLADHLEEAEIGVEAAGVLLVPGAHDRQRADAPARPI